MQLYYLDQLSVLQPESLVEWKRNRSLYNFQQLPQKAIFCSDFKTIKDYKLFRAKKLIGIKGKHFIVNDTLYCSDFGIGAPATIQLMEELRVLGVKEFLFIGYAGIISNNVSEGRIYSINKSVSGVGTAKFYSENSELYPNNLDYFNTIISKLDVENSTCFSIDAPYRETRPLISAIANQNIHLIDMECAAIYAFATFYNLSAVCFLIASDNLINDWTPPKDLGYLQNQMKLFIQKLSSTI